ncbi:hypothetical protein AV944_00445 [Sphingomonas sp. LK11]|uniref:hypothetical protein n=1 Tax=Sphingomonas sp. LK11 TaxID=1390395 RepID=UPI000972B2AC|nr:hypothetical protein [Sphingomonas sp. LK11]APX64569.1 hypothetical protein AV944_00445 [Sphingomonas sp. LK11]
MARTPTPNTGTNTPTTDTTASQGGETTGTPENAGDATDGEKPADEDPIEMVEARVTLDFEDYVVNDVAELPAGRVDQLEREGYIDTHADAVAYAKSLA